ncbi:ead/Ea22-like family protein [Escherichia coli]
MTNKIDYQKLREIAEKTKIAGEAPVMPFDQRINALNDFMKHFSPDIALALLDEVKRLEDTNIDAMCRIAELETNLAALAAENELARKAVQAFCDVVGDNTEVIAEVVGRDGVLVILEAMKATGNMPATDAFLAEIERKAIRKFINSIEHILRDKLSPYDTEEMLEAMRIFLEEQGGEQK